MNRAERRRIERENKSKIDFESKMLNWIKGLNEHQRRTINAVIDEKVSKAVEDRNILAFESFGAVLEILTDFKQEKIKEILTLVDDFLVKYKKSNGRYEELNSKQKKQIIDECNALIEEDLETAEAIDCLHTSFPGIRSSDLVAIYKKVRDNFLKPTVEVDMDIELKEFERKMEQKENAKKRRRENSKNKNKNLEDGNTKSVINSDNKDEKEVDKMSSKSKFKVVERNITLESELATYKVSNEGITTDCIDGKMTTFKDKDEANKLIGKLINKLMDLDEEIKDIWKEYIDR